MPVRSEDPVLKSSRREAVVALVIFIAAFAYTVGYSVLNGYGPPAEGRLTFVLGFPSWIFWGVVVPWVSCLGLSWWFAFGFMTDEDLGKDPELAAGEEPDGPESRHA